MKRHTITLGASTTTGGKVISASSHGSINGVKIALEDDVIFCPICKSKGKIVCIGPRIREMWNGKHVALENDLCFCSCAGHPRLVSDQFVKYQVIDEVEAVIPEPTGMSSAVASSITAVTMFNDRYVLIDEETGEPLTNAEYALRRESGNVEFGTTDAQGRTHLLAAALQAESIQIYS